MIGVIVMMAPVVVSLGPAYPCTIAINQVSVAKTAVGPALRDARRQSASAKVMFAPETPWRCLGDAITLLSRAGFRHVVYDPPLSPQ